MKAALERNKAYETSSPAGDDAHRTTRDRQQVGAWPRQQHGTQQKWRQQRVGTTRSGLHLPQGAAQSNTRLLACFNNVSAWVPAPQYLQTYAH